ncbi:MAG TPA: hypothetical protein VEL76_02405, partial [Gemmataceae bacterium]|nr:hypothetical protein [Gemmataceae bacterium]
VRFYLGEVYNGPGKALQAADVASDFAANYEAALKNYRKRFPTFEFVVEGKLRAPLSGERILLEGYGPEDAPPVVQPVPVEAAVIAIANFNTGASEPGWASAWEPASPNARVQKQVVFEGDGALFMSKAEVKRRLSEPQRGRFVVEQYIQVPKGGGVQAYIRNGDGLRRDGPVWNAINGKFLVLQGDGKGNGTFLETPFVSEPGKWHKVTLTVDVPAQRWEFSVDDRKFQPPQPLRFRSTERDLDTIYYLCENVPGVYLDSVRFLRDSGSSLGK